MNKEYNEFSNLSADLRSSSKMKAQFRTVYILLGMALLFQAALIVMLLIWNEI
jgi:hypothetical protein